MPNIFDARSFAAEKINGSMQCDFLSQDYFNRSNAEKNAVDCLKRGYTLVVKDTETGNTPLHLLAQQSSDPFILENLAILTPSKDVRESLVEVMNFEGKTAFHIAVEERKPVHFLANLLRWGGDINQNFDYGSTRTTRGGTVLHQMAQNWRGSQEELDTLIALIAMGADPDITNEEGDAANTKFIKFGAAYETAILLNEYRWEYLVDRDAEYVDIERKRNNRIHKSSLCLSDIISEAKLDDGDITDQSMLDVAERRKRALFAGLCVSDVLSFYDDPSVFWGLLEGGSNFLHRLLKLSPEPRVLDAVLAAADYYDVLEDALEKPNIDGYSPIHIAASFSDNPINVIQLVRWGANIDVLYQPRSNGWSEEETGDTPLHLAARREPLSQSTRMVAALMAVGASTDIHDNNAYVVEGTDSNIGLLAIDYMNRSKNYAALSLIAPGFSYCKKIDEYKGTAAAALGLSGTVTATAGGATIATSAAGVTAVAHSSGAIILTGSGGYIAGTLGALGSTALAVLTAPATLFAAGGSVVLIGGSVLYCSSEG